LSHVQPLLKIAVEERRLEVQVVHVPTVLHCNRDEHTQRVKSGKHFIEVDTGTLDIALCNKASLVLDSVANNVLLWFEENLSPIGL
jgi:hypothetical protein